MGLGRVETDTELVTGLLVVSIEHDEAVINSASIEYSFYVASTSLRMTRCRQPKTDPGVLLAFDDGAIASRCCWRAVSDIKA